MNIYLASHNQKECVEAAALLKENGHKITSRWIYQEFFGTECYTEEQRSAIAKQDADDVLAADALILFACDEKVPGGKFVEVGMALWYGKKVYLIGRRENMLMWHPDVIRIDSLSDFITTTTSGG